MEMAHPLFFSNIKILWLSFMNGVSEHSEVVKGIKKALKFFACLYMDVRVCVCLSVNPSEKVE
jgi:hypothetical protein